MLVNTCPARFTHMCPIQLFPLYYLLSLLHFVLQEVKSRLFIIFLLHFLFTATPPALCSPLPLPARCCPLVAAPQALAQAIKEAKEQHPDMSVTRVVVHKETELTEEED